MFRAILKADLTSGGLGSKITYNARAKSSGPLDRRVEKTVPTWVNNSGRIVSPTPMQVWHARA
ncbi:hypothetical protein M0657_002841 [Pyricularia oryzae]|uniref:Uncharacterized protein n=1 Tax=Pyricularia oryzae (strain P131) TaxID=1143193 RepID=L7IUI7_PYRO1|nr:hypothetical protein M9X92_004289 [Pyricularia oryzae]KAI7928158.1 hypothetical protein M0657_002841 [Pyricularia oryzae]